MKRGICIGIIVLFLIAVCSLEQLLVSSTLDGLKNKTQSLEFSINEKGDIQFEEILLKTKELNDFWTNNENLLCFFINHKDMQEMGIEINKMQSYLKSNNIEEFLASFNLVVYYTNTFNHIMGLSLQNLI